jgi:hypothetical protein
MMKDYYKKFTHMLSTSDSRQEAEEPFKKTSFVKTFIVLNSESH